MQRSLKNIMSAIEQGIVTETTKSRLLELKSERSEIEGKIAAAKADIVPVNREQLIEWLLSLREGDIHDKSIRPAYSTRSLLPHISTTMAQQSSCSVSRGTRIQSRFH